MKRKKLEELLCLNVLLLEIVTRNKPLHVLAYSHEYCHPDKDNIIFHHRVAAKHGLISCSAPNLQSLHLFRGR